MTYVAYQLTRGGVRPPLNGGTTIRVTDTARISRTGAAKEIETTFRRNWSAEAPAMLKNQSNSDGVPNQDKIRSIQPTVRNTVRMTSSVEIGRSAARRGAIRSADLQENPSNARLPVTIPTTASKVIPSSSHDVNMTMDVWATRNVVL